MPRVARKKSYNSVYHVMCRSISEVNLYKNDEDKLKYLKILSEYKESLIFKVYCYCIMNNHCHFIIDANGSDISEIFHGVNYKYAMYYNKQYERHGHLFQDRFKSKIIDNDRYMLNVSGYIHANPLSLSGYNGKLEDYKYSSLGIYLGIREDELDLLDHEFISDFFLTREAYAKQLYLEIVQQCTDENIKDDVEFKKEEIFRVNHREVLTRGYSANNIIEFLSMRFNISKETLKMKNSRDTLKERAIFIVLMKCLCNYKNKDLCGIMGNMSQSNISILYSLGKKLMISNAEYGELINEFLKCSG